MIVTPGRWLRNKSTDALCVVTRVVRPWVWVSYRSGVESRHHIDKIIKGYEASLPPAKSR